VPEPEDVVPPGGSPVALHGALSVTGNQVVDKNSNPVQLKGMSLFWSQWMGKYYNSKAIDWLVDDWMVTVIRVAMGVEMDGYLNHTQEEKDMVQSVVEECILKGIYVIVDWHDHHANMHLKESKAFFKEFSHAYGAYPNVLWEIWNEPEEVDWAKVIKPYHEELVPVIRKNSKSIIILGTDRWSSGVDTASEDPVAGKNLAYTLHFYAFSHKDDYRRKAMTALNNSVPVFVSEWGTCDYSGNGTLDLDSSRMWAKFMDTHNISFINWAVSDKYESCSALLPGANENGDWKDSDLTPSGFFVRKLLRGEDSGEPCQMPDGSVPEWPCIKPECATADQGCAEEECCEEPDQEFREG
jgi:endoglucanase